MRNEKFLNTIAENFLRVIFLDAKKILEFIKKFFRDNISDVIGVYFDGEKIFIARLTKKFETIEVDADGSEIGQIAEQISQICKQKNWKTSAIGLCLRDEDAVTFQTEINNVPEKELPALVKSWATAQAGTDAIFSFTKLGEELWMETLTKPAMEEAVSAFKKFGMNLRALSVMPANLLTKIHPYDRTEFIAEVILNKKTPNLLAARSSSLNLKRIYQAVAGIFIIALIIGSANLFFDYKTASDKLDTAKISVENLRGELALKETLDEIFGELHRRNNIAAQVTASKNFNLLINLGKISDGEITLTKIRVEENSLELEGVTDNSDALKNYLGRVKNSVAQSARLENSSERDDKKISFVIRAALD